jgi:hypothetical protein
MHGAGLGKRILEMPGANRHAQSWGGGIEGEGGCEGRSEARPF